MGRFFRAAVAMFAALAALSLAGCAAVQPVFSRSAPDFSALARTYGPAVVNIGVSRAADATPSRAEAGSLGSGFINARIYSVNGGGNQGLAFAIPIDAAMRIKEQLQAKGSVTRGRIGVAVQELSQALAESFHLPRPAGALVSYIEAGGAAERAGLKPGDVILAVRGQEVVQSADALGWIADTPPGETVRLTIWREGAPLTVDVVVDRFAAPATRAASASAAANVRAPLGLVVRALSPQERRVLGIEEGGLLVQRVTPGTLQAGVKPGDLILALNGQPVATPQALAEDAGAIDGAMALLVQRGASRLFIPICVSTSSIGGC